MPRPDKRVSIRTERLLLRPFGPDDAEDRLTYARDPGWGRFLGSVPPADIRDAEQFIAKRILASWSTEAFFAVVLDETVIGGIGLHPKEGDEIASLDYGIASAHWARAGPGGCASGHRLGLPPLRSGEDFRRRRSAEQAIA